MECPPNDTRTALLHAALASFAESGFDGTSIRMIAERAQRPLSLLAHHFGNKEGLVKAMIDSVFRDDQQDAAEAMSTVGSDDRLHRFVDGLRTISSSRSFRVFFDVLPYALRNAGLRGRMARAYHSYRQIKRDWLRGNESLNRSYTDYMVWLMNRQIREGGCTHFYFDISFSRDARDLSAGFGYRLPDGRIQPTSMDGPLRTWYQRCWALAQENDLYPGAISGHATNSICLKALPFADAVLDVDRRGLNIGAFRPATWIASMLAEMILSHLDLIGCRPLGSLSTKIEPIERKAAADRSGHRRRLLWWARTAACRFARPGRRT